MIKIDFHKPHNAPPVGVLEGSYIIEDCNAGQMLQTATASVHTITQGTHVLEPGGAVCITRPGGYGDLLFLRPILTKLQEMGVHPVVCCADYFSRPVKDFDTISYPMSLEDYSQFENHVFLENLVETSEAAKTTHVIDLIADRVGVQLEDREKQIEFDTTEAEKAWARDHFPKGKRRRIGVQLKTSSPVRNYPPEMLVEVLAQLERDGWEIMCLARMNEVNVEETDQVRWVGKANPDFGESCAVLQTCDVCLAPDSALCHVAGAFKIPTVALYGPFLWQVRTKYAPSIRAITGQARCAPCWYHSRSGPFPQDGPCMRSKRCEAMADISPERILKEIDKSWKLSSCHVFP